MDIMCGIGMEAVLIAVIVRIQLIPKLILISLVSLALELELAGCLLY